MLNIKRRRSCFFNYTELTEILRFKNFIAYRFIKNVSAHVTDSSSKMCIYC